jgi:hypothetical protein
MAYSFDPVQPYELIYKIYDESRSDLQNRYLNGWIYKELSKALDDAGIVIPCDDGTEIPYTRDILHDHTMAVRFRVVKSWTVKGSTYYEFESTAKMSKKRFRDYIDEVVNFSKQYWGVDIPQPQDNYYAQILKQIYS